MAFETRPTQAEPIRPTRAEPSRLTCSQATGSPPAYRADFAPPAERRQRRMRATAWIGAWAVLAGLGWLGVWPILDRGLAVTGMGDGHVAGLAQLVLSLGLWVPLGLVWGGCLDKTGHAIEDRTVYKVLLLLETWCVGLLVLYVLQLGHPERWWRLLAGFSLLGSARAVAVVPLGALFALLFMVYMRVYNKISALGGKLTTFFVGVVFVILYMTIVKNVDSIAALFSIVIAAAWYPWIVGFLEGRFVCGARRWRLLLLLVLFFAGVGSLFFGWLFCITCLILLGAEVVAVQRRCLPLRAAAAVLWTILAVTALWRILLGPGYVPTVEEGACVLFVLLGTAMVWTWRCGLVDALEREPNEASARVDKNEKVLASGWKLEN